MSGIIPARAGFTAGYTGFGLVVGDHPRSRGVYALRAGPLPPAPGSSPLARGLHRTVMADLRLRRIIPARAGFTC